MTNEVPLHQRPMLTIAEACKLSTMSETTVYRAIGAGELKVHKRGRRNVVLREDLDAWVRSFPTDRIKPGPKSTVG